MRLGLVIYGSLDTVSGGYLYDRRLVRYLQQQGDDVQIISLPWTRYGSHLLHNFHPAIRQQLRQSTVDILLQDELNHPSLFWLNRKLKKQLGCPLVSIVHHLRSSEQHPPLLMTLYRFIEGQYLRTIDGFIFNSITTRATVTTMQINKKPSVVAYPATNHLPATMNRELIIQRSQHSGPLRLIFVGNITPRKGCHYLLKALAELPEGSWQLKMIGDMTVDAHYVRRLKYQSYAAGIHPNIHWHGRLSAADLARHLAASQVLVVPSTYEGFGIVYLEAMNYGLPAIATTAGAAHEIITDGLDGFLVPPDEPTILAERIQRLCDDRALLAKQSLAAFNRASNHPTWAVSMARARQFLVNLLS